MVREIRPFVVGRRLTGVRASRRRLRRPWSPAWGRRLRGREILDVRRRGKWIVVDLSDDLGLLVHLGMTGRLVAVPAGAPVASHTHLVFDLASGGMQLRFRDPRRFGAVCLLRGPQGVDRFFLESGLGPEPFGVDRGYWRCRLAGSRRCLKAILLDQRVVAGVGNIYADEALFAAGLHPARPGPSLAVDEADRLRRALVAVLRRAIRGRGSTIRDYVGGSGRPGGFQRRFRVYGRTGEACFRCGGQVCCLRLAGRSSHFCPRCQPLAPSPAVPEGPGRG